MRSVIALISCVLCSVCVLHIASRNQVATGQEGFNNKARLTIGVTRKLFKNKSTGAELPQGGQTGTLTAQLFDDAGGAIPIWTEVHAAFTPPADDVRMALTLGGVNPFKKDDNQPIPFNDSPFILLTLQLGSEEYVTPRMAIAIAGYSHQAGAAYEAVGSLLGKLNDYEKRIKVLEYSNTEILKKVYREIYDEDPPAPPQ